MSIQGPNSPYQIDPIGDRPDDESYSRERRKRRAEYKGRKWGSSPEEKLSVKPRHDALEQKGREVVVDKRSKDRALALFDTMTTLEEKLGQLCLVSTVATYDVGAQNEMERMIMGWQIGGVVFKDGNLRRQSFLIDRYQEVSKTPLLIGNDFKHGLANYYRGDDIALPQDRERLSDLGKAVMGLNRSLKVHFQFDRDAYLTDDLAHAFRNGVRQARGLVARTVPERRHVLSQKPSLAAQTLYELQQTLSQKPSEISGIRTLNVYNVQEHGITQEGLLAALRGDYDCFLCDPEDVKKVIAVLSTAVLKGRVLESEFDQYVMKLLYLKARLSE